MEAAGIIVVVLVVAVGLILLTMNRLICICQPSECLIFSGHKRRVGDRVLGYKIVIGGKKLRIPLFERVDKIDLTNMIIEVNATNAYSKGGIPLTLQGVANIKVASEEPILNAAIERFLAHRREGVMKIAQATLEGALRGVLAAMTPEQINEDKLLFADSLVVEADHDMTNLGLAIDTLQIQNVHDDVGYLDSIGRKKNAQVVRRARIAEAKAKAKSIEVAAENREREAKAQIDAQIAVAKADANKRLVDALTRREAVVAEENATVAAAVAHATAEVDVQTARKEQIRRRLEADIVEPAKAYCEAKEANAKATAAPIIEDGRSQADALRSLAISWKKSGANARDVFLLQKLDDIIGIITDTVADTKIESLTMIDARTPDLTDDGSLPIKAVSTLEQVKQIFGVDLLKKLQTQGGKKTLPPSVPAG